MILKEVKNLMVPESELRHYGVMGMRWGVRRAKKRYAKATSKEGRSEAISKLKEIKSKGENKVQSLTKKGTKLQKQVDKAVQKYDTKAAYYKNRAAKVRMKKYGMFTSKARADEYEFQAGKLEAKANSIATLSEKYKKALASNQSMIEAFNREISDIDSFIKSKGKRYLSA